jgi:DNA-binding response OmpR family regulator
MEARMARWALVVEDDAEVSRYFVRCLGLMGWEVDTASTAESALQIFEPGRYGLVICDVNLGQADGIEVASHIRSQEPAVRVVITSGLPDNLGRARKAGFTRCLRKPFGLKELHSSLRAA